MNKKENNIAFIDGQNLHLQMNWSIDFKKFKIYLKDKLGISDAYYFLGFKSDEEKLYRNLQKAGFILVFNSCCCIFCDIIYYGPCLRRKYSIRGMQTYF